MLREEVERHREMLFRRAGLGADDFDALMRSLLAQVVWVPRKEYEAHLPKAIEALERWDPDDVAYLACALAVGAEAIWSHDKDFDRQDLVRRVGHPDAAGRVRSCARASTRAEPGGFRYGVDRCVSAREAPGWEAICFVLNRP
jgi:predicted nucleic acid-binding protein